MENFYDREFSACAATFFVNVFDGTIFSDFKTICSVKTARVTKDSVLNGLRNMGEFEKVRISHRNGILFIEMPTNDLKTVNKGEFLKW